MKVWNQHAENLAELARQVAATEAAAETARHNRLVGIRAAIADKMPQRMIAEHAGVTHGRIGQLAKSGRRRGPEGD